MNLSTTCIKRPVLPVVFSLLLLIAGMVGFYSLPDREYPNMDPPVVNVTTTYTGANPEIIQTQVTEPIEEELSGIEGIRVITSSSAEQVSQISVEFGLGEDLERAANDVRDRVSRAVRYLPKDVDPPIVEKLDANASPVIFVIVESDEHDILEVNDVVDRFVKDRLQTIPGIAGITIFGEKKFAMRLWLDPEKMKARGITSLDVNRAVNRENQELPSGRIDGNLAELGIRTLGLLTTDSAFNNLIIKSEDGTLLRFSDIGNASLGCEAEKRILKNNLKPVVVMGVVPQPGANTIDIADEFYKRVDLIQKELPAGYHAEIGYDFTIFERRSIAEVKETLFLAFFLVVLIIFVFLRDWRSTIIPVVAIPVSIIATFFLMWAAGLSINVLTLMGLVLAIGLVCDDAIVVLEIIYTKVDSGMKPVAAAIEGSSEIFTAIISTTITLAMVFLPILFLQGLTGKLFSEFVIVVAGSVMISAFIALSLSPMMGSRMLVSQHHLNFNWFYRKTEPFFVNLNRVYRYSLSALIRIRFVIWPVLLLLVVLIYLIYRGLHSELAPLEDRSNIRIGILGPEGASYEFMEKYMDQLSQYVIDSIPEATRNVSVISPSLSSIDPVNKGMHLIYLTEPGERERSQHEIFQKFTRDIQHITGIGIYPFEPPTIGSRFAGQPIQFVIQAGSFDSLKSIVPRFLEEAGRSEVLRFTDANLKVNKPELHIFIDREKAALYGVSAEDIGKTLQLALSGQRYGYFIMNGQQYEVIGQLSRRHRNTPANLEMLEVRSSKGTLIPLSNVVNWKESVGPSTIFSFDRYYAATISAGLNPGYAMGDGIEEMKTIASRILTPSFRTALAGQSRDYAESSSSLMIVFLLALVIIFLVLAAQFDSFVDPLVILVTVPLALFGALLSLWVFGQTLNIFSQIGLIMLIGLVTKNGILIVEFANQKKRHGMNKQEAVLKAAVSRLRPILMTALATIFGILPIALALGSSSGSRQSLGIAVVGGMIFATFLSLFFVPVLYTYLSREYKTPVEDEEETEPYEPIFR
ncbi:MAG TPA: efflux RND transporter permease subunit [Bacteroidales bacterium]|nr:efflux RND transporter permease subunit [Bacteroidales bacterium]HSA43834.1 efflux RND transporter permease subunit [Bacteroidales bacterium]